MSQTKKHFELIGNTIVDSFHILALFIIIATVAWSATVEYITIINRGSPTLRDILLLFIYLEVVAMVGIYFKTKRLPVVFLIYIAITALTRVLTVDIKTMEWEKILVLSTAILILAIAGTFVSRKNPLFNYGKKNNQQELDAD